MRVGVNDGVGVAHDGDVTLPEDQVAALQFFHFRWRQRPADSVMLHVAVARAAGAGGGQHDLRVVASLASHLIVMRHGKVVEKEPAAELFKNPKSDYTRALFAAAFRIEAVPEGTAEV